MPGTTTATPPATSPTTPAPSPTTPTTPTPGAGTATQGAITPGATATTPMGTAATSVPSAGNATSTPVEAKAFESKDDQEGEDIYEAVAKLAPFESFNGTVMNTGDNLKIACYMVYKPKMNYDTTIQLKYGQDIQSIAITDTVSSFGTFATVDIVDTSGNFTSLLEYQLSYYFVITILNVTHSEGPETGAKVEHGILYQPYIFEIDSVESLSDDGEKGKIYRLTLSDIISATLKKVSYGNLLLHNTSFPNLNNFAEVYQALVDYAALIINLTHNKKYKLPKTLYLGGGINDSLNPIIKDVVLKDVLIDTPLYALMDRVYKMAAREMSVSENFAKRAEVKGMVLTPLMLMDEWEDTNGTYRKYYQDHDSDEFTLGITYPPSIVDEYMSGGNRRQSSVATIYTEYLKRGLYLKHLQMPFQLVFGDKEAAQVYEVINPRYAGDVIDTTDYFFHPMNGYTNTTVDSIVELPIDAHLATASWKNISIMSDGTTGATNALIYFNWILEYYKSSYLYFEENIFNKLFGREAQPVVDPIFNLIDKADLCGGEKETFAKINSITVRLRSSDPVKEALWHVGRSLKSYIFLNAMSGFKIKGNIIRHPGEIIKINTDSSFDPKKEIETPGPTVGGIDSNELGFSLGYITSVTHVFNGAEFQDIVYATKICKPGHITFDPKSIPQTNSEGVPGANNNQTPATSQSPGTQTQPTSSTTTPTQPSTSTPAPTPAPGNNQNNSGQF